MTFLVFALACSFGAFVGACGWMMVEWRLLCLASEYASRRVDRAALEAVNAEADAIAKQWGVK